MKEKKKKVEKKEKKLLENFSKIIIEFLSGKTYTPLNYKELIERLSVPEEYHLHFRKILRVLTKKKIIETKKKTYLLRRENREVVSGTLHVHHRGFAFLQANDPLAFPQDIFIPKHLTGNAVHGDVVEVQINQERISEKGPEGKVIAILKRERTHVAGIIQQRKNSDHILAYVPLLGQSRLVRVQPSENFSLSVGDRAIMKVLDWGNKERETICEVSHLIGHISDPSCDIQAAIEEFGLRANFPNQVILDVKTFGIQVSTKEIKKRLDLRKLECFTIDPSTAKDFDDALSLKKDPKGHYHLGVHIADVSHYVKIDSSIDKEAKKRCNSTYFPGYCLPMLPPNLSENLCSLKEKVNRLTVSVLMEFDKDGNLLEYEIVRTTIRSARRFTYQDAKKIIDGVSRNKHSQTLLLMVQLCNLLKKKRYERGCIEFTLPETRISVDAQGAPQGVELIEYDISHQLVEEFMIKANEVIATHLTKQGKRSTYRIHEEPKEESLKDFSIIAGAYGFYLSENPSAKELQDLFDDAKQSPFRQHLATSYIRSMKLASYSQINIGHYGLSLDHYCHFTSPIRRYADLTIHRQLFEKEVEDFQKISEMCSEQERISAKAEQSTTLLKKLRLLEKIKNKNPYHQFDAIITKVKPFGFYFEVVSLMLEGFLRISELDDDYFVFDEKKLCLRGNFSKINYYCGEQILVTLLNIDFIFLESKWGLITQVRDRKPKKTKAKNRRKTFRKKRK